MSFIVFQSCQKEETKIYKEYPNVDAELWQYFEKFEKEGKKRGVEIDLIGKGHNDEAHEDGTCKSIMRSGTGACIDNYNEDNRGKYCDELFDM